MLQEAGKQIRLRTAFATSQNFRKLTTLGFRALHYSGHGMENCLVGLSRALSLFL